MVAIMTHFDVMTERMDELNFLSGYKQANQLKIFKAFF